MQIIVERTLLLNRCTIFLSIEPPPFVSCFALYNFVLYQSVTVVRGGFVVGLFLSHLLPARSGLPRYVLTIFGDCGMGEEDDVVFCWFLSGTRSLIHIVHMKHVFAIDIVHLLLLFFTTFTCSIFHLRLRAT